MERAVLRPGEGEVVTDDETSRVAILVGTDELAVTVSTYAPGESGPGAHVHHEHVDAFYVLDGEVVFRVGPDLDAVAAGPGTFVAAPPELLHTFRNEGSRDGRFLNLHAPSKDFHRHLRGEDVDFDTDDPPGDGGSPASEAVVAALVDGPVDVLPGTRLALRAAIVEEIPADSVDGIDVLYALEGCAGPTGFMRFSTPDAPPSTRS
jgi:mannose-6-phosphate isomerase-like protein (cupin superfamily)